MALVIGNDAYHALPNLNNAAGDARGLSARLETLGFRTTQMLNTGRRELHRALDAFEVALRRSDVGLLYYAGHSIQTAQVRNYLIPADAQLEEEALRAEGITVDDALAVMQRAPNPLNVFVLDACRDNPLPFVGKSGALRQRRGPDIGLRKARRGY